MLQPQIRFAIGWAGLELGYENTLSAAVNLSL